MKNIPTEKLGTSEWMTATDIKKLEKMYKCKPKHERIKNLGKYLRYFLEVSACKYWNYGCKHSGILCIICYLHDLDLITDCVYQIKYKLMLPNH